MQMTKIMKNYPECKDTTHLPNSKFSILLCIFTNEGHFKSLFFDCHRTDNDTFISFFTLNGYHLRGRKTPVGHSISVQC